MKALDLLTENEAHRLIGQKVIDVRGKKVGTLQRIWPDPSTYHPEFAGIRTGWLFPSTHVVPARDIRFDAESELIRLERPSDLVKKAPHANPKAELAQVEKEEIDAYYGYFVPLRRISDIREIRPEDAPGAPGPPKLTATPDELLLRVGDDGNRR